MRREILGSERAVWKAGAISLNIVLVAKIIGEVRPVDLGQAWLVLQEKHPLLNVHLEKEAESVFFSSLATAEIPVRLVKSTDSASWQEEVTAELQMPFVSFSRQKQPLVRSVLIIADHSCDLIITCHHCLADGLSLALLMRDILYCLAGQGNLVHSSAANILLDKLLPPHISLSQPVKFAVGVANFLFTKLGFEKKEKRIAMPKSEVLSWALSIEETNALLHACRQNKVTVHAALITVFQAAQQEVQGEDEKYLHKNYSPVSLRNRLTETVGENFGLYAAEAYISCPYNKELTFWQNAQLVHQKIKASLNDQQLMRPILLANLLRPALLDRLMLFLYQRQPIEFGFIVSNLGVIDVPETVGSLKVSEVWGPVGYVKRAEKTLSILTFAGQLSFTVSYRSTVISTAIVEKIKERSQVMISDIC